MSLIPSEFEVAGFFAFPLLEKQQDRFHEGAEGMSFSCLFSFPPRALERYIT